MKTIVLLIGWLGFCISAFISGFVGVVVSLHLATSWRGIFIIPIVFITGAAVHYSIEIAGKYWKGLEQHG